MRDTKSPELCLSGGESARNIYIIISSHDIRGIKVTNSVQHGQILNLRNYLPGELLCCYIQFLLKKTYLRSKRKEIVKFEAICARYQLRNSLRRNELALGAREQVDLRHYGVGEIRMSNECQTRFILVFLHLN